MTEKTTGRPDTSELDGLATPWFALLERALLSKDYERAAVAKRELEQRGVSVHITPDARRVRRPLAGREASDDA